MSAVRLFEAQWLPLSPKELLEGILLWGFGYYMGRKHLVLPARKRHKELVELHEAHHAEAMAAHHKLHKHLGIEDKKAGSL